MDIMKGILSVFKSMPTVASAIGAVGLTVIIFGLVVGVFIYQSVVSGNIDIDGTYNSTANTGTGMKGTLLGQSANFSNIIGVVWDSITSVAGFIVLGAIALIAIAILGRKFFGGGRV